MSFERWIETANKDQAFYLSSPAWQVRTAYQAGVEAKRERSADADLLGALKALRHADGCFCEAGFAMPDGSHPRHSPECEAAYAAIAKAEGRRDR